MPVRLKITSGYYLWLQPGSTWTLSDRFFMTIHYVAIITFSIHIFMSLTRVFSYYVYMFIVSLCDLKVIMFGYY